MSENETSSDIDHNFSSSSMTSQQQQSKKLMHAAQSKDTEESEDAQHEAKEKMSAAVKAATSTLESDAATSSSSNSNIPPPTCVDRRGENKSRSKTVTRTQSLKEPIIKSFLSSQQATSTSNSTAAPASTTSTNTAPSTKPKAPGPPVNTSLGTAATSRSSYRPHRSNENLSNGTMHGHTHSHNHNHTHTHTSNKSDASSDIVQPRSSSVRITSKSNVIIGNQQQQSNNSPFSGAGGGGGTAKPRHFLFDEDDASNTAECGDDPKRSEVGLADSDRVRIAKMLPNYPIKSSVTNPSNTALATTTTTTTSNNSHPSNSVKPLRGGGGSRSKAILPDHSIVKGFHNLSNDNLDSGKATSRNHHHPSHYTHLHHHTSYSGAPNGGLCSGGTTSNAGGGGSNTAVNTIGAVLNMKRSTSDTEDRFSDQEVTNYPIPIGASGKSSSISGSNSALPPKSKRPPDVKKYSLFNNSKPFNLKINSAASLSNRSSPISSTNRSGETDSPVDRVDAFSSCISGSVTNPSLIADDSETVSSHIEHNNNLHANVSRKFSHPPSSSSSNQHPPHRRNPSASKSLIPTAKHSFRGGFEPEKTTSDVESSEALNLAALQDNAASAVSPLLPTPPYTFGKWQPKSACIPVPLAGSPSSSAATPVPGQTGSQLPADIMLLNQESPQKKVTFILTKEGEERALEHENSRLSPSQQRRQMRHRRRMKMQQQMLENDVIAAVSAAAMADSASSAESDIADKRGGADMKSVIVESARNDRNNPEKQEDEDDEEEEDEQLNEESVIMFPVDDVMPVRSGNRPIKDDQQERRDVEQEAKEDEKEEMENDLQEDVEKWKESSAAVLKILSSHETYIKESSRSLRDHGILLDEVSRGRLSTEQYFARVSNLTQTHMEKLQQFHAHFVAMAAFASTPHQHRPSLSSSNASTVSAIPNSTEFATNHVTASPSSSSQHPAAATVVVAPASNTNRSTISSAPSTSCRTAGHITKSSAVSVAPCTHHHHHHHHQQQQLRNLPPNEIFCLR